MGHLSQVLVFNQIYHLLFGNNSVYLNSENFASYVLSCSKLTTSCEVKTVETGNYGNEQRWKEGSGRWETRA